MIFAIIIEAWNATVHEEITMIKAIIFDYGNVISSVDNDLFLDRLSRFTDKCPSEMHNLFSHESDLPERYETGLITSDEFFAGAVQLCSLKITKKEFRKLLTHRFTPIQTTHDLIRKLKHHYTLGLLSNTNEWDFEVEIQGSEVFSLFDTVTVSFKTKAMKPARKIYIDALSKLNREPHECVYIDDIREYADAASEIGINSIHYTSHDSMAQSLRSLNCYPE